MSKNKERQHRIDYEIIVDCYDDHEINMGWAIYMEEKMNFPFKADAPIRERSKGINYQRIEVVELETTESNYEGGDFYLNIDWQGLLIPVPLSDLRNIEADEDTLEAIGDWKYWNGEYDDDD